MQKRGWLTVLAISVLLGGGVSLVVWNETQLEVTQELNQLTVDPNQNYTLTEMADHNNATSCWTAINDNVYDLTRFIEEHPGGAQTILSVCGLDGTDSFNNMPPAIMPVAKMTLVKYQIGSLVP